MKSYHIIKYFSSYLTKFNKLL